MKIVLLPGLDGTGNLFRQFIHALPPDWEIQVIRYPNTGFQNYAVLTEYVRRQLPVIEPYCLLAESFSGPIAYHIASSRPPNLLTVVFVATFLDNPRPFLLQWRTWLPLQWKMPDWLVRRFLLGNRAEEHLIADFWDAVKANNINTLQQRLTAIATLPKASLWVAFPCIYLQPSNDWLVPNRCVTVFKQRCKQLKVHQIIGTHFLLQSSPEACAQIVKNELQYF